MEDYIVYLIATLIMVPIIATWLIYKIAFKIFNHKQKAFHISINWTTVLYIIAVSMLSNILFDQDFIGIILIILLSLLSILIIIQWKTTENIILLRAFKILWRLCFVSFFILYIGLILTGIIMQVFFK